jgi:hypothetical protein
MLADALRMAGNPRPGTIRFQSIINDRTMRNAVQELGGRITGWSQGVDRAGKPFIQAVIAY